MDESTTAPNDEPGTLMLEGYTFVKALDVTVLSRCSLYLEHSSNGLVVVEEIAEEISQIPGFDDRFQDRMELVAPCIHQCLTRLQPGGFTHNGRYYLMREYVEGQTLQQWTQSAEWSPARAHQIILSLAGALEEFHRNGVVHGAVNASTIWIDQDGAVKLEICPVATLLEPTELVRLLGLEVVNAMPPEFTTGVPPTPQSDLYALGSLYYELLTGTAPRGVITRISSSLKVDIRVSSVILKALSHNPAERQASIAEFCAPLLGNAAHHSTSDGHELPAPQSPRQVTMLFIVATVVLSIAASVGSFFAWKAFQPKKNPPSPAVVTDGKQAADVQAAGDAPSAALLPQLGWVGIEGNSQMAEMKLVLLNAAEMKPLLTPSGEAKEGVAITPPILTHYYLENEKGAALCEVKALADNETFPIFSHVMNLSEPTPQSICLALRGPSQVPLLKSQLIEVADAIAVHRILHPASTLPPAEAPPAAAATAPMPSPLTQPIVTSGTGDAYFYAAHFYLGNDVSLLKFQLGNAGIGSLDIGDLTFQCAFSIDDTFDALTEFKPGALPSEGLDLAAGGFSSRWLGIDSSLAAGKKFWTKHTFRIDTSNPELLKTAKYLLVKVNQLGPTPETNDKNNVIAIPLGHPEQWHSVTQDPKDDEIKGEADPTPAVVPGAPVPK